METKIKQLGKVSITVEKDYWTSSKSYDKLVIVEREGTGTTYISRKPVPAGTSIFNRNYWIKFSKWSDIPYEISQEFGNSTEVTISQKTLTTKFNQLDEKNQEQSEINQTLSSSMYDVEQGLETLTNTVDTLTDTVDILNNDVNGSEATSINSRLTAVEALAEISVGGGDVQIENNASGVVPSSGKVPTCNAVAGLVVDNLATGDAIKVLSAKQGYLLKGIVDDKYVELLGGNYIYNTTDCTSTNYRAIDDTDGSIKTLTGSSLQVFRVINEYIYIPPYYRGKNIQYYHYKYTNQQGATIAFYDTDKTFISAVTNTGVDGYYDTVIPSNAVYIRYGFRSLSLDTSTVKFTFYDILGYQPSLVPMNYRLGVEENTKYLIDPLGVNDNFIKIGSFQNVSESTKTINNVFVIYNNTQIGIRISPTIRYQINSISPKYTVLKIKKTGVAGRTIVITTQNFTPGSDISTHMYFTEDVKKGYSPIYQHNQQWYRIIDVNDEYIWLYLPSHIYLTESETDKSLVQQWTVLSCSSYTSKSVYTLSTLEIDIDGSFILEGDKSLTWDIATSMNIYRKYYSRPEKLNSQLMGKNVFVFSDSLSYFAYGLVYDWGCNVYNNSWGGARMGYEGGSGQGGETETYEAAWLCRDSYIQYVKTNVINAGVKIDYIVCTAGVNGSLPDTDATEIVFVANNKRWYHDTLGSDPWSSLSSTDKARFTSSACTYVAFYSLCRVFPEAIPVIVAPYRTPGPGGYQRYCADYDNRIYNNTDHPNNVVLTKTIDIDLESTGTSEVCICFTDDFVNTPSTVINFVYDGDTELTATTTQQFTLNKFYKIKIVGGVATITESSSKPSGFDALPFTDTYTIAIVVASGATSALFQTTDVPIGKGKSVTLDLIYNNTIQATATVDDFAFAKSTVYNLSITNNVATIDILWDANSFAQILFNENLLDKRNKLEAICKKLGGVFVDCYSNNRSSIANVPKYFPGGAESVHPTRHIAQDMASQIGNTINKLPDIVAKNSTLA